MLSKLFLLMIAGDLFSKTIGENNDIITNGTELVLAFVVHRHGDRTPINRDLSFFCKNPQELERILDKYGTGQLTPRGLYRSYQIGQFIRRRYSSLLSSQYNESEIYIRSTDITRTKMTVLTAMAAVYSSTEDSWCQDINWTPVPYSTVDVTNDYVFPFVSCPRYAVYMMEAQPNISRFRDILEKWSKIIDIDLFSNSKQIYNLYANCYSIHSLELPLIDALEEISSEIEEVAAAVLEDIYGYEETLPLLSGVLLNQFYDASLTLINGEYAPRVRVYSAHDLNVFGMIAASKIEKKARPGIPKFGATFVLELRRIVNTGQYVVLSVYVPDPDKTEVRYLLIEGCDSFLCDYEYFRRITSKFALEEDAWKAACVVDIVK